MASGKVSNMAVYPNADIRREAEALGVEAEVPRKKRGQILPRAVIASVEPFSPADDAGFEPGCVITHVDGQPLRDIIDWRWLAADDAVVLGYIDLDGDSGEIELWREEGEDWGITFKGVVFDGIRLCRNACKFCFMHQLPPGMRPSLSLRDDDFRMSFLSGTFVTLTNLTSEDEERILEQRISPLRVSLHAVDDDVRRALIGKHAKHGLEAIDRLLSAGIEMHAQIVLVPGENDGEALIRTLEWAYARPGVLNVGIVPLGYTSHQAAFESSFNDAPDALAVIRAIEPFQQRALNERGTPWVFAADEFYRNAYGATLLENLPPAVHYGDFSMFEDGIGIIRSYVDDFLEAQASGLTERFAQVLERGGVRQVRFVVGEAMEPFMSQLIEECGLAGKLVPLVVKNRYFGGNVDVTGLLTGQDIAAAIVAAMEEEASRGAEPPSSCGNGRAVLFVVPSVILNDDGVTLDDMTMEDMEKAAGVIVAVVSCNPSDYLIDIINLIEGRLA